MRRGAPILFAVVLALASTGCSWVLVERTHAEEPPRKCADRDIPGGDVLVSSVTGGTSLALGVVSMIFFFGPEHQSDTGEGIIYGSSTAIVAGLLAIPALLFGLSSRYGYANISACEQLLEVAGQ